MEIFKVQLAKRAEKEIQKLPSHIVLKLTAWVEDVGRSRSQEGSWLP